MNLNPIKLIQFKGQFEANKDPALVIERELDTANFNLHTGTWQICVKNFSYFVDVKKKAEDQIVSYVFIDVISNLLYEQNPTAERTEKFNVDVILGRFACHQNKCESINGDTWFNVTKPCLTPTLLLRCHNLHKFINPQVPINVSILLAFRRIL